MGEAGVILGTCVVWTGWGEDGNSLLKSGRKLTNDGGGVKIDGSSAVSRFT